VAGLTDLADALELMLAEARPLATAESCTLDAALGRILAADIHSDVAVPQDDNSAMDGYALRSEESAQALKVTQRIAAGSAGTEVCAGTAARIFTGAPIPPGADAVVMQENCDISGDELRLLKPVAPGENIRLSGQDIAVGDRIFSAGRRLRGEDLGVIASIGMAEVSARRPLVVGILSTGDELVEPGSAEALQPGQLFNSNRYTLYGMLTELGFEVRDFGIVPDSAEKTAEVLAAAAAATDCVISSGGVSVGEEDHVKAQVEKLGQLRLWKLRIKPGKPLAYGRIGDTPFFGLPGNPAAVFVTFSLVVRPWLLRCQGAEAADPLPLPAIADFESLRAGSRLEYMRARVGISEGQLHATLHPNQSSGVLSSVSWANALAVMPPGTVVARGDVIEVLLLDQLSR
jgi:molybdopterin molybdotransferase